MVNTEVDSQPTVENIPNDISPTRDRIVILGRRSAGKTVYLSLLYDLFWKPNDNLSMKAVNGANHLEYIKTASDLRKGIWPAATQNISQGFIEITYNNRKKLAVLLDYPGELFTNAFVNNIESEDTRILLDHIDHAEAIILLADPEHVVTDDVSVSADNDYGLVQAMSRVLNWSDGYTVPVVLVLTKIDENQKLIKENGGTAAFVKKYFPKLVQDAKNLRICKVSAVQVEKNKEGRTIPKKGFKSKYLEKPVLYCFDVVDAHKDRQHQAEKQAEYMKYLEALDKKEKYKNAFIYFAIFLLFIVLVLFAYLILPSGVWQNIFEKLS